MGGSGTGLADGGHQQHDLDGEGRLTKGRPPRPRWWWTAGRVEGWGAGPPWGWTCTVPYRTAVQDSWSVVAASMVYNVTRDWETDGRGHDRKNVVVY